MKLINKKNDLKSTIPLMALFVALNLIITVYATYLPLSGYIVILFLPLISTIYCLNTKKRYFPIYFIVTLGLAICFSIQDLTTTLLYLLPALLQGLFFSLFIDLKKDGTIPYFISIAILFLTKVAIIPFIDFIYQVNTINSILTLLNLIEVNNIYYFVYFALFILCSFEMFIVFIITKNELLKLGYKINLFSGVSFIFIIISALSSSLALIFSCMNFFEISYTFLAISFVSTVIITIQLIRKKIVLFSIVSLVALFASWMIFVAFLQHLGFYNAFSTLSIFGICMSFAGAIYFIYVHYLMNKDSSKKC